MASGVHVAGSVHGDAETLLVTVRSPYGERPLGRAVRVELDGVRVIATATKLDGARSGVPVAACSLLVSGGVHIT